MLEKFEMENEKIQSAREKRGIHEIDPHDSEYLKIMPDAKDKHGQEVVPSVPCVAERVRGGELSCEECFEKSNASCSSKTQEPFQ